MRNVDEAVVKEGKIYAVHRNYDIRGAGLLVRIVVLDILYLGDHHPGDLLLQDMIDHILQLGIYGEIEVAPSDGIYPVSGLGHPSEVVYENSLHTLLSLQLPLLHLLDARFSHHVVHLVVVRIRSLRPCGIELRELLHGDLSSVSQDMGHARIVYIFPDGVLLDIDALQGIRVLHDLSHRLLTHVGGDRGGEIFLEAVETHLIAYGDYLQYLLLRISLFGKKVVGAVRLFLISAYTEAVRGAKIGDYILRRRGLLTYEEVVNICMSEDIRKESQLRPST